MTKDYIFSFDVIHEPGTGHKVIVTRSPSGSHRKRTYNRLTAATLRRLENLSCKRQIDVNFGFWGRGRGCVLITLFTHDYWKELHR